MYVWRVISRKALGAIGEEAAVRELRRRGYKIRDRNVRCPMGELDLVAEDQGTLVFLEVKTRSTSDYGSPFEAISLFKQQRLQRLAVYYLSTRRLMDRPAGLMLSQSALTRPDVSRPLNCWWMRLRWNLVDPE